LDGNEKRTKAEKKAIHRAEESWELILSPVNWLMRLLFVGLQFINLKL